ncbi:MAG: hypothetical protein WAK82_00390 [Streptosporangiaceae bacterium]
MAAAWLIRLTSPANPVSHRRLGLAEAPVSLHREPGTGCRSPVV